MSTSTSISLHDLFVTSAGVAVSVDADHADGGARFRVPELQRDYVWTRKELTHLLTSLQQAYKARHDDTAGLGQLRHTPGIEPAAADAFRAFYERRRYAHHLGFLYAYHDEGAPGVRFLIDGQQRLTSLYLLLLVRAVGEGQPQRTEFEAAFLTADRRPRLQYLVREATAEFLGRFVDLILTRGLLTADEVKSQYWYLRAYDHDVTIRQLLANYEFLRGQSFEVGPDFDFLAHFVRFWYFDTGNSRRGENLYLALNSTGLPLTSGENERARLLQQKPETERRQWGEKLEKWQDFFWKHRRSNTDKPAENADRGYSAFFEWLWAIGPAVGGTAGDNLLTAEHLMKVLEHLFPHPASQPAAMRPVSAEWPPLAWMAPDGELTLPEQFRLLPVLAYGLARLEVEPNPADWQHLRRVVRYFYNLARLPAIDKANRQQAAEYRTAAINWMAEVGASASGDPAAFPIPPGPQPLWPDEERIKLTLYYSRPAERLQLEELLWSLEDDAYNKGQVSHLFEAAGVTLTTATLAQVQQISACYTDLELGQIGNRRTLQSLLMLRGDATVIDTWSALYEQFNYGNWRSIVRGQVFGPLFGQLVALTQLSPLAELLRQERAVYFGRRTISEWLSPVDNGFDEQLAVLDLLFSYFDRHSTDEAASIWRKGDSIARYFSDHQREDWYGREDYDAAWFGDATLRFWSVRNNEKLSRADWKIEALIPRLYRLVAQYQPPTSDFRAFVLARLLEAGAKPVSGGSSGEDTANSAG